MNETNHPLAGDLRGDVTNLSIDIDERLRLFFSRSSTPPDVLQQVSELTRHSLQEAHFVPCVGLSAQVPLAEIYQVSRLHTHTEGKHCSLDEFLNADRDRIIMASPGLGKTTLMNYALIEMAKRRALLPLMFVLRLDGVCSALIRFISALQDHKDKGYIPTTVFLLFIDGFDEISSASRYDISKALAEFSRLGYGYFYLSCRLNYEVGSIASSISTLGLFEEVDAIRYAECFLKYASRERYAVKQINAEAFINDLVQRRLFDVVRVPLLLSLACVVRCETSHTIPTNAVELLDRAIELLNDKWDRIRQIKSREMIAAVGPYKRLALLKALASRMPGRQASEPLANAITAAFLKDNGLSEISPAVLLNEIVQLSGLMRRTPDYNYQFMHAAIQDFLAAKHSVESGEFFPTRVSIWDSRAGYAACLSGDATQSMIYSLRHGLDNVAFNDCLLNGARFDSAQVAKEIVRLLQHAPVRILISAREKGGTGVEVRISHDFFESARNDLIDALLAAALFTRRRETAVDVVVGYCLFELKQKMRYLEKLSVDAISAVYGSLDFCFIVSKGKSFVKVLPCEVTEKQP